MDEEVDHGPIIAQKAVDLKGDETAESLHQQLFQIAADMLPKTMQPARHRYAKALAGGQFKSVPQNDTKATYCKKITKEDGYFDIENPPSPEKLDRMIRAYYPWPTAWSKLKTQNSKLKTVKFLPGKRIQLEGGKPMSMKDFLNGYPELKEAINKLV